MELSEQKEVQRREGLRATRHEKDRQQVTLKMSTKFKKITIQQRAQNIHLSYNRSQGPDRLYEARLA